MARDEITSLKIHLELNFKAFPRVSSATVVRENKGRVALSSHFLRNRFVEVRRNSLNFPTSRFHSQALDALCPVIDEKKNKA